MKKAGNAELRIRLVCRRIRITQDSQPLAELTGGIAEYDGQMIYSMLYIDDTDSSDGCSGIRTGMHTVLLRRSKHIDLGESWFQNLLTMKSISIIDLLASGFSRYMPCYRTIVASRE